MDPVNELRDFLKFMYGPFDEFVSLTDHYYSFAETKQLHDPCKILAIKLNHILGFYDPDYIVPKDLYLDILKEICITDGWWGILSSKYSKHNYPTLLGLVMYQFKKHRLYRARYFFAYLSEKIKDHSFATVYLSECRKLISCNKFTIDEPTAKTIATFFNIGIEGGIEELAPNSDEFDKACAFDEEYFPWSDSDKAKVLEYNKTYVHHEIIFRRDSTFRNAELYQEITSSRSPHFTYARIIPKSELDNPMNQDPSSESEPDPDSESESGSDPEYDEPDLNNILELSFDHIYVSIFTKYDSIKVNLYTIPVLQAPKE